MFWTAAYSFNQGASFYGCFALCPIPYKQVSRVPSMVYSGQPEINLRLNGTCGPPLTVRNTMLVLVTFGKFVCFAFGAGHCNCKVVVLAQNLEGNQTLERIHTTRCCPQKTSWNLTESEESSEMLSSKPEKVDALGFSVHRLDEQPEIFSKMFLPNAKGSLSFDHLVCLKTRCHRLSPSNSYFYL